MLICLENTGMYGRSLIAFLQSEQAYGWVENSVEIKWSMSLVRGKNDQMDAQRICLYALRHQDKANEHGVALYGSSNTAVNNDLIVYDSWPNRPLFKQPWH